MRVASRFLTAQKQADFLVQAYQKARSLDYVAGMFAYSALTQMAQS